MVKIQNIIKIYQYMQIKIYQLNDKNRYIFNTE